MRLPLTIINPFLACLNMYLHFVFMMVQSSSAHKLSLCQKAKTFKTFCHLEDFIPTLIDYDLLLSTLWLYYWFYATLYTFKTLCWYLNSRLIILVTLLLPRYCLKFPDYKYWCHHTSSFMMFYMSLSSETYFSFRWRAEQQWIRISLQKQDGSCNYCMFF